MISKRKRKWFGNILRRKGLLETAIDKTIPGKTSLGRSLNGCWVIDEEGYDKIKRHTDNR